MSPSSIAAPAQWWEVEDVAEDLERWTEKTPETWTERTPEPRYLYDRVPTFGLARDAERMREGVPPERRVAKPRKPQREWGPVVSYLKMPWSYSEGGPGDFWRRVQCRRGHHAMGGGHTMQLGSAVVFIERQCRWCGAGAGPPT